MYFIDKVNICKAILLLVIVVILFDENICVVTH